MRPTALQVTFCPDPDPSEPGVLVWWGPPDPAEAARRRGLPEGAPGRLRCVVPEDDRLTVTHLPVRLVPLDQGLPALTSLAVGRQSSDSLRAWRTAGLIAMGHRDGSQLDRLAELLPPAANPISRDGETVWRPGPLLRTFLRDTHRTFARPHGRPDRLREVPAAAPAEVRVSATLRPYQLEGVGWLRAIAAARTGGVLADDMGLGKTLQTIALLAGRPGDRPHLVVCPTSVVGNWARELHRFAPGLPVVRHHGTDRATGGAFPAGSVVVTSYSLLLRDITMLADQDWDVAVMDEAQQIKNHTSQTAKAARRIPAAVRLALTGTPVENRLTELWSIMDYTNPGLLGTTKAFAKRFAEPVEQRGDTGAAGRLRELVAPYLLRRLKADVATDLPAKQESIVACSLTSEQASLYRTAVSRAWDTGFGAGIERHGRILKLLTELKQICNHPAQHLKQDGPLRGRSGKLDRATEMLAEAVSEGAQSLVFTQYRVMGELLARHLAERLALPEVPFLHGGVRQPDRDVMVARFQNGDDPPPILIVSLKAGGTGLNLTAASHVLHYDRWWNPAVEDQATDRAHRIGQDKPVDVYKLVTGGTLEERIADLLERKRSIAEAITGTGEDWITRLDDAELRKLVLLSEAEVAE
ncbi:helicase-like protein [Stackebrandtia albiflava]|uniref:Helicase-like protein n=1 Tax=Stackebrandtia albiflava TaxID=406432 RepID=A0A562VB04_9ACTN|nr:DEAD/DEAH box helicase [Stackebrandtia albiflava]TWJ15028.1 helicase-like protein [Stackebrandtia albiflava]